MVEYRGYAARRGPFRADQVREGDPYEVSEGHAIHCLPTGGRGAIAAGVGFAVLSSDPAVQSAGVEAGFTPAPDTLRAPDVSVGNVPDEPGWVQGVPPLAVEYADTGQDEQDLARKIGELLAAGTRFVWVVRLAGPRRVEIHEPQRSVRTARPGDKLEAPGILQNAVPVEALYDWKLSQDVTLTNLLQRKGYRNLDAVRAEGRTEGKAEGKLEAGRSMVFAALEARGLTVPGTLRRAIEGCTEMDTLTRWLTRAVSAAAAEDLLAP